MEDGKIPEIFITMLPNSADVEQVALGESGLMNGICAGQLFIDMSTISPLVSKKITRYCS